MGKLQDMLAKYSKLGYYDKFDYHWGMTIDLDRCSGCEACVVACQAENNLPIVGEQLIKEGKEVRWLRIERYWQGEYPNAKLSFLPMLCQHCDQAPCETVCPVSATYHNQDGLNTQVYNRCIGTRTCAVYCTYDVRYFNWFTHTWDEPLEQQLNPDVTVRERGVMEKCTFCIQRIRLAKDTAKDEGRRRLRDGEVTPACVQSCPTEAMVFGDMNDPNSRVSKMADNARGYKVLKELNTSPSIVYLSKVESHV
ncbi:MAG: 4Fe-4S dicluster domain-containing protein [Pseudomonadales bacterium]|jgi:molybdopterin-containing oxidoreductase family iron-sulfur binding subunit|nr:4Fe-4S dicluster domain-containing protein [Pseudomonadales bacterium]HJN53193.1 4Fe-4S dicluster domain-containing protein [Pseudomonadales bacterium]|tara:strand:+ start:405 stop:1160 length:756 start_codon:yes stop_codon:yes gene_type:complete